MDDYAEVPAPEVNRAENILADRACAGDKDFKPDKNSYSFSIKGSIMNPIIKGILFTALSGLKMFVGTVIASLGVPQNDQDAVVKLADDIIDLVEGNEPPTQALLDSFDPAIVILKNAAISMESSNEISLAIAAFVGALEGLKAALQK